MNRICLIMMSVALVSPSALAQMPPSEYDTAAPSLKLDVLDLRNMDVNDVLKIGRAHV